MRASILAALFLSLVTSPIDCDRRKSVFPPGPMDALRAGLAVLNECSLTEDFAAGQELLRRGQARIVDLDAQRKNAIAYPLLQRVDFNERTCREYPPRFLADLWLHELTHLALVDESHGERWRTVYFGKRDRLVREWVRRHGREWRTIGEEDTAYRRAIEWEAPGWWWKP